MVFLLLGQKIGVEMGAHSIWMLLELASLNLDLFFAFESICSEMGETITFCGRNFFCVGADRVALKGQFEALTGYLNEIGLGGRLTDMIEQHNQRTLEPFKSTIDLKAEVNTEFPDGEGNSISGGYMLNAIYGNALRPLEMVIRAIN